MATTYVKDRAKEAGTDKMVIRMVAAALVLATIIAGQEDMFVSTHTHIIIHYPLPYLVTLIIQINRNRSIDSIK